MGPAEKGSPLLDPNCENRWLVTGIERTRDSDLNFHFPNSRGDGSVKRVFAKAAQIRISGQPFEIAITQAKGFLQGRRREVKFRIQ